MKILKVAKYTSEYKFEPKFKFEYVDEEQDEKILKFDIDNFEIWFDPNEEKYKEKISKLEIENKYLKETNERLLEKIMECRNNF